ncbi:hypothetical protein E2C01_056676 [Portunus trituberculatus]|uniref:Uncharacterized protein n=1 Tax=Portunus trituberculatus TaxID=210409 RepID=A0A5B7GQZ6_PORTR|nr:hypothetical protein [Portunus trituberculatus]
MPRILTNHEQGNGDVFRVVCLDGSQHGAHHGAAQAHEGNHDDEPANAHRLRHHQAAARLGLLFPQVGRPARRPPGPGIRGEGLDTVPGKIYAKRDFPEMEGCVSRELNYFTLLNA